MIDRAVFFPRVRATVFHGTMTQSQVDGLNSLLDALAGIADPRWLAYMLATAYHETASTMQPIAEYGCGRGRAYGEPVNGRTYYGRGYVQLTWLNNYEDMSEVTGVDLVSDPDRALEPAIAAQIMSYGMVNGSFTGKTLADYLTPKTTDFVNARRIINGLDRAALVGSYAHNFLEALGATK